MDEEREDIMKILEEKYIEWFGNDDDNLIQTVFKIFKEKFKDEFNFVD